MTKKKIKKEKAKKDSSSETANGIHRNIRCRNCLITDGYSEGEKVCRYCAARLSIG